MPMVFLGAEDGAVQESMPMVFLGAEDDAVQEFCGGESDSLDELGVEYLVPSDARLPCDRSPGTGSAETSVSAMLQERVTQNARQPEPALDLPRQVCGGTCVDPPRARPWLVSGWWVSQT